MNRSRKLFVLFLLAALDLCPLSSPRALAAGTDEFSATMLAETGGGANKAKIYHAKDMTRIESDVADSGIAIARQDKGVAWLLVPAAKMYIEVPLATLKTTALTLGNDIVVKREKMGNETVDGRAAVKEKVTVKNPDGSQDDVYYWKAEGMDWPVKAAALDGSWSYTFTDVKPGKQDPALFELPAGYEKTVVPPWGIDRPDDEGDI